MVQDSRTFSLFLNMKKYMGFLLRESRRLTIENPRFAPFFLPWCWLALLKVLSTFDALFPPVTHAPLCHVKGRHFRTTSRTTGTFELDFFRTFPPPPPFLSFKVTHKQFFHFHANSSGRIPSPSSSRGLNFFSRLPRSVTVRAESKQGDFELI